MGFFGKIFGKNKQAEPHAKSENGTVFRPAETGLTREKTGPGLTALEIAEQKAWEAKTLPDWNKGDMVLETYLIEDMFEGGMGRVYIAEHKDWKTKLAIKQPNEMMLSQKDLFARILREANSWVELGLHPNIAYCYYVRNIEDVPHIVVEYVDGGNLLEWIADGKCMDYKTNLDLAIQFCHGMEWAHKKGMIHRDLKPENVLMTKDGLLKITDFGLVKTGSAAIGGRHTSTRQNHKISTASNLYGEFGTPGYYAPEQLDDPSGVDERADIFSFGVCLYEMFCGARPYDITIGPRQEPPEPAKVSLDDNFPPDLAALLKKCIQWNREDRPGEFEEIRKELTRIHLSLFNEPGPHAELELVELEADGLNNRGVSFMDLGREGDAVRCWQEVHETNSTHPQAVYNMSVVRWRRGEITDVEVLRCLDDCLNDQSVDHDLLSDLKALVHIMRLDIKSAEVELATRPDRFDAVLSGRNLGYIKCTRCIGAGYVTSLSYSPDGRGAVVANNGKTIREWDLETGQCRITMEGQDSFINTVAYTPDGRRVVSASNDETICLWDLGTGQCVQIMVGHTDEVRSVCVSPDGRHAVSGGGHDDRTIRLWDLHTSGCLKTIEGHTSAVMFVSFSPDGRRVISGGGDKTVRLWDIYKGQCLMIMRVHTHFVWSACFSPDGRRFVTGSEDRTVRLWDVETGQCLRTMDGHTDLVWSVSITPDGRFAASGSRDKTVRVWDLETGQCLRTIEVHTDSVRSVSFSPDGKQFVTGSEDGTIRIWDLAIVPSHILNLQTCRPKSFTEVRQEQDGIARILSRSDNYFRNHDYEKSHRVLVESGYLQKYVDTPITWKRYNALASKGRLSQFLFCHKIKTLEGHKKEVLSVCFNPDGRRAVSGSDDATICVWDIGTGRCLQTICGHTSGINSVSVSTDGRSIISGSGGLLGGEDCTVRLWDFETGQCLRTLEGHTRLVLSVCMSPDGRKAVSGSYDGDIRLWDLETGDCIRTMKGHTRGVSTVSLCPDGQRAVSGSFDEAVCLWDLESGQRLRTMKGHNGTVKSVSSSRSGRHTLSGSVDKTIRLWDYETGECLRILEGHTHSVLCVSLSPDGRRAVSGSEDKTIRLWDIETGRCLKTLEGIGSTVNSVCFSPDGLLLLSGSEDKSINVWRLIWDLEFD